MVFGPFLAMVPLFFVNLNTSNMIFLGEKIKQIYIKKDNPLLSQVFKSKKPRARHGNKLNYLISHMTQFQIKGRRLVRRRDIFDVSGKRYK